LKFGGCFEERIHELQNFLTLVIFEEENLLKISFVWCGSSTI